MHEAACEAAVLVGLEALHVGLDHVYGVVGHDAAEASKASGHNVDHDFPLDVLGELLLGVLEDHESHSLIR